MSRIFIINAHEAYPFSEGKLNQALTSRAMTYLEGRGHQVRITTMTDDLDVDTEVANHQWADVVIIQTPVNWMGVPWTFKRYMDQVYTAGMDGRLCNGDGRTRGASEAQYGAGGSLGKTRYMLSLTYNAPREAFDNPHQYLLQGKGVDDMFLPMHLNFRFFGMTALPTFVCYDVMKNPDIENDFNRFDAHLAEHFPAVPVEAH